jgi:hypothetical protein
MVSAPEFQGEHDGRSGRTPFTKAAAHCRLRPTSTQRSRPKVGVAGSGWVEFWVGTRVPPHSTHPEPSPTSAEPPGTWKRGLEGAGGSEKPSEAELHDSTPPAGAPGGQAEPRNGAIPLAPRTLEDPGRAHAAPRRAQSLVSSRQDAPAGGTAENTQRGKATADLLREGPTTPLSSAEQASGP